MRLIRASLTGGRADGKAARNRMESRIERLCIERGLKMTGQRRVVARVLSEAGDHPDVEELYRRASALDQHISIATVYRTVRLFEEQGILERRDFGGGRARYEPSEDGPHYHLIDVDTGKVIEFQDPEHERLMHAIAARLGFDVVSLRLELFGRRHGSAEPGRPEAGSPELGSPKLGSPKLTSTEMGHPEMGKDDNAQHDSNAVSRELRLRDSIRGATR
jgi:Fur family ferric uptake transcriptional regulator